jgi:hypothetical protein
MFLELSVDTRNGERSVYNTRIEWRQTEHQNRQWDAKQGVPGWLKKILRSQWRIRFRNRERSLNLYVCMCVCLCVCVCVCVCMYVCMYSYQPKGWLDPHTELAPDAHTHTQAHTHKYTYSTPHTTTARRTKPGVEWGRVASSFPPPYCTQSGNDEVHRAR